jgi:hypothetical protein
MIYLKGILVGISVAVAASVLYVLAVFVLPLLLPFLLSRITGNGGGGGCFVQYRACLRDCVGSIRSRVLLGVPQSLKDPPACPLKRDRPRAADVASWRV